MNRGKPSSLFPVFLKLAGRKCLVVGAGQVGELKTWGLLAAGAAVTVVSPRATQAVESWAREGKLKWRNRRFEASDLDGVFLAVVATPRIELNEAVFQEARRRGILCNVVDDPDRCDFYYPAVVRRGAFQIAISTNGRSPALAQRLRKQLENEFGPVYERWVEELGTIRRRLFREQVDPEERRRLLHQFASKESFKEFRRRHDSRPQALPERSVPHAAAGATGED